VRARRLALTAIAYVAGTLLVLGVSREVAQMLAIPPLFLTILAGMAVLGLPLALVLAWRYRSLP